MSKHKLYIANTTSWLIDRLENSNVPVSEAEILDLIENSVNIDAKELYDEVKTVKSALGVKKRSPNRCTSDKSVSSKYLLELLTKNAKIRKSKKIEFVANNFNHIASLKNDELLALGLRVTELEKLDSKKKLDSEKKLDSGKKLVAEKSNSKSVRITDEKRPSNSKKLSKNRTTTSKCKSIKICAFNIANFGATKFKRDHILEMIVKILYRYDLTVVQEIRSEEFDVIEKTLHELNNYCQKIGSAKRFKAERSNFVGNEHRQEQYGYFYNTSKLKIDGFMQFEDENDVFRYEPAFANFLCKRTGREFTVVGVHIQKDSVVAEMNKLIELYDMISEEFGTQNVVFTGDFNAEGSYLSKKKAGTVDFFNDPRFKSLISHDVDTTVSNTDYAYDRIFVAGDLFANVKENAGEVFRFDQEFNLTQAEAFKVSDHYPIEFKIE